MIRLVPLLSVALALSVSANPADLSITRYSGSDLTPSPACLAASADGNVFVGVDLLGSLGKGPGKGSIVRLTDTDQDGKADKHTVFAMVDDPRGLISMGDKLYVLHTIIPADTGILTGMDLSVFEDKNGDGIADGPPKTLIKDISVAKHNQDRGADHTTNGIRMGIDGWIYIAVGDFGFVNATGTDGKKLNMLGGGVVRVRPDGTQMEVYTHGTRNIYDVAIDPYMNIFTRGNTNDGGGWNVRFIHHIQSGEYGYPVLFKGFTDEIIPALEDFGGGSGTGALFMDEPTWPEKYNHVPMMCDWGRNEVFIHRLTVDGSSFTQKAEDFIGLSQPTDLDVDGSGQLYIAAWDGAGYKGNPDRGFVDRVVPQGWTYKPFPVLSKLGGTALIKGLATDSATTRLATQQEILTRNDKSLAPGIFAIANDSKNSLASRVAAIFTSKQLLGEDSNPAILNLVKDTSLREFALRALTDRLDELGNVPQEPFYEGLRSDNPRVRAAAVVSLGRLGKTAAASELLTVAIPPTPENAASAAKAPLFESAVISGNQTADIDIDLSASNNIYLIAEDVSEGKVGADVGWFDPILNHRDGKTIPLTKFKWEGESKSSAKAEIDKTSAGKPLRRADGKPSKHGIGVRADSVLHYIVPGAMRRLKITAALGDTSPEGSAVRFKVLSDPPAGFAPEEGPHATPNSPVIIPHLAIQALVRLHAIDASLAALDGPSREGALRALQLMHDPEAVKGLISKYATTTDKNLKKQILAALARLDSKEAPYDGSWWWNTRPDTRGPYYVPVKWEESPAIEKLFQEIWASSDDEGKTYLIGLANKNRMNLQGIGKIEKTGGKKAKTVGDMSIENVMLALDDLKGDPTKGAAILKTQACVACHAIAAEDKELGPDLKKIGAQLDREAIAEAILKPDAGISKSWVDVTTNDGTIIQGTLVEKSDSQVIIRDIAGIPTTLKAADVKEVKTSASTLMGPHLLDALTMKQFADVISYLHSLK